MRVELQQIVNALLRWQGNVKAAAEELGMRRKNLYERLERAGLDLASFRAAGPSVESFRDMTRVTRVTRNMARQNAGPLTRGVRKSARAPYREAAAVSNVSGMEATEAPFAPPQAKARLARIRPADQERLRSAKIELIARYRMEADEQAILDRFMEECFPDWLAAKLKLNPKKRAGNGEEPGGEG